MRRWMRTSRPRPTQPSIPPGVGKWVPASAGKATAGHSVSRWTRGVQVKLWDPLRTRAIPERLRGVFTTRRYTNPRLPLPLLVNFRAKLPSSCWDGIKLGDNARVYFSKAGCRPSATWNSSSARRDRPSKTLRTDVLTAAMTSHSSLMMMCRKSSTNAITQRTLSYIHIHPSSTSTSTSSSSSSSSSSRRSSCSVLLTEAVVTLGPIYKNNLRKMPIKFG